MEWPEKTTIRRNITDFMWKQLHGTLKIGNYWLRIPSHKEKAYCKECQNLETLSHILFECQIEGREEIWDMAEKLWNRTTKDTEKNQWTAPSEQMI